MVDTMPVTYGQQLRGQLSRDGTKMIWVDELTYDGPNQAKMRIIDLNTKQTGVVCALPQGLFWSAEFAPSDAQIYFTQLELPNLPNKKSTMAKGVALYRIPVTGGEKTWLLNEVREFKLSPDGKLIEFRRKEYNAVLIADADGRNEHTVLESNSALSRWVEWEESGVLLVQEWSDRTHPPKTFTVDPRTGERKDLIISPLYLRQLYFIAYTNGSGWGPVCHRVLDNRNRPHKVQLTPENERYVRILDPAGHGSLLRVFRMRPPEFWEGILPSLGGTARMLLMPWVKTGSPQYDLVTLKVTR